MRRAMTNSKHFVGFSVFTVGLALLSPTPAAAQPVAPPAAPPPEAAPSAEAPAAPPAPAPVAPAASAAAPAPAPVFAPPPAGDVALPSAAPMPPPPPPVTPPEPPRQLSVGSAGGSFQPGALLQAWLDWSHQDEKPSGASVPVADEKTFTFRLRRAELSVKGDIVPKAVAYKVVFDPARALEVNQVSVPSASGTGSVTVAQPVSPLTILQDFYITFQSDYADVSVGQFKVPVSYEGSNSASKILFPERAAIARYYGDKRDVGLRVEKKLCDYFGYVAGLYNGNGQNRLDDDTDKDGALRLEGYFEGLTVAGVGYTTIGKRKKSSRDRLEADLKYDAHSLYVIAEYIHGWDSKGGGKAVEGNGTYIQAAYTLFDHFQPMVRVGEIDPNMDKRGDHYMHYEAGAAWLFHKYESKLTLAGAIYDPTHATPPSNPKRAEVILAAQASF